MTFFFNSDAKRGEIFRQALARDLPEPALLDGCRQRRCRYGSISHHLDRA